MGCQNEQNPVDPFFNSNQTEFSKATIPYGSTIDSAVFYIDATTALNEQVTLHRVTADWQEMIVTWNNFAGNFNVTSEGSFTPSAAGWYETEVTNLVSSWVDSTYPNFGILLKEESPGQIQIFSSRESGMSPYLKVWWSLNGTYGYDSTAAFTDTYIQSDSGDVNFGSSMELITGWQDAVETQSLVGFEIEIVYTGCTRSKGYWKTHSSYGPAPYDSGWALLGEDSTFFLSNQSNYEVMWTPPSGGNAYYKLAHQYIATAINILNGADPGEVQETFDDATDLFNTYTPEDIGALKGNNPTRQEFNSLKSLLAQYNGGEIGPGSCEGGNVAYPDRFE
ncbi:MAG: DNRLRE domain-containing protein [Ignavibacteriaceae bacterium]|nr:DNRLRE domain-containing protein [Ignavibacteriaceae bacterium]